MSLYRGRYRIESARWSAWDYGAPGWYFVTICAQGRFFGEIFRDGTAWLSEAGQVVAQEWARTALIRPRVRLDAWVVMPDHFHGIVGIIEGSGGDPGVLGPSSGSLNRSVPNEFAGRGTTISRGRRATTTA